ncbi:MAG TPA: hypothetical protein VII63_08950 [Caulobacteraceae bacterium]
MSRRRRSFLDLGVDLMRLGMEAQGVVALRMMRFATGGVGLENELSLMFAEKARAAVDVQIEAGLTTLSGRPHLAPARAVALYRRRVRANQRRLSKNA